MNRNTRTATTAIVFGFMVCLFYSQQLQAQKGFHLGAKGIFNSTWIVNQNNYGVLGAFTNPVIRTSEYNYKPSFGGTAGITAGYNFNRQIGIQLDVLYDFINQNYEDDFDGPAIVNGQVLGSTTVEVPSTRQVKLQFVQIPLQKLQVKLQFVQIPLQFKFLSLSKRSRAKFYATIGPQVGFLVAAKEHITVGEFEYSDTTALATKDKFIGVDFGFTFSLGTEVYVTPNLFLSVGFTGYASVLDLNGKSLREIGYYSQNDTEYQKSHLFRAGINAGIHYLFGRGAQY